MDKEQELNEYLAEGIMGWEIYNGMVCEIHPIGEYPEHKPANKSYLKMVYRNTEYRPLTNLEQAFEVLEEWLTDQAEVYVYPEEGQYALNARQRALADYQADTKPKAIIGAILKAEGVYEDYKEVFE
jgi:hypothetical protein